MGFIGAIPPAAVRKVLPVIMVHHKAVHVIATVIVTVTSSATIPAPAISQLSRQSS